MIKPILEVFIGFSGGLAVGGGFIAFLMLLNIIPRLLQISQTKHLLNVYISCVILGAFAGTYLSFTDHSIGQSSLFLSVWGIFHGIFNGMLIAALAEVLNIFPIISKRIGMKRYLYAFLMAIVFGKVIGSLFQWLILITL